MTAEGTPWSHYRDVGMSLAPADKEEPSVERIIGLTDKRTAASPFGASAPRHQNDHAGMSRTAWDGTPLGSRGAGYG